MNTAVVRAVHRTRKMHQGLGGEDAQKKAEMTKEIRTTIMLVSCAKLRLSLKGNVSYRVFRK